MPPGEQAPRSTYRPNPHSLRSTNAFGDKHKKTKIIINFGLTKKCFVGLLPLDSWDRLSGEDAWDKAIEELAHRDGLAYAYSCALLAHQLFKGVFYVFF